MLSTCKNADISISGCLTGGGSDYTIPQWYRQKACNADLLEYICVGGEGIKCCVAIARISNTAGILVCFLK